MNNKNIWIFNMDINHCNRKTEWQKQKITVKKCVDIFLFLMFVSCRVQNPMTMHQSKTQKFMVQQKNYHTHTQVHGVGPTLNRAIPLSVGHNPINRKCNPSSAGSLWIQCVFCDFSQHMSMEEYCHLKHLKSTVK